MTNNELITDALRELGVIDAYQDPNAEDSALALRKLNSVMASLKAQTIELGYFAQDDVNEDIPISDDDAALILPIFAMALSINFPSAQPSEALAGWSASNHSRLMLSAVLSNAQSAKLTDIPMGAGRRGSSILNG